MHTTSEYNAWRNMNQRCGNKNRPGYNNYGGRGIAVCDRWKDFTNFIEDMGMKPSLLYSLDRIDNNGDYEPENCRWADKATQDNNRRTCHNVTIGNVTKTLSQWIDLSGIKPRTVQRRIYMYNWLPEVALTKPTQAWNHKTKPPGRPKKEKTNV